MLQHRDEKCSSVNATKVEKNNWMAYAEIKTLCFHNVLSAIKNGLSASKSRKGKGSSTIS